MNVAPLRVKMLLRWVDKCDLAEGGIGGRGLERCI